MGVNKVRKKMCRQQQQAIPYRTQGRLDQGQGGTLGTACFLNVYHIRTCMGWLNKGLGIKLSTQDAPV